MKPLSLTATVGLTIAAANLVSAGFLLDTVDQNYEAYCGDNASRRSEPHVCIHADRDVTPQIRPDDPFEGYVAADAPNSKFMLSSAFSSSRNVRPILTMSDALPLNGLLKTLL